MALTLNKNALAKKVRQLERRLAKLEKRFEPRLYEEDGKKVKYVPALPFVAEEEFVDERRLDMY